MAGDFVTAARAPGEGVMVVITAFVQLCMRPSKFKSHTYPFAALERELFETAQAKLFDQLPPVTKSEVVRDGIVTQYLIDFIY